MAIAINAVKEVSAPNRTSGFAARLLPEFVAVKQGVL
jgi:hypothetical protein